MDVDQYHDKWVTLDRVDKGYDDLANRVKTLEDEMASMKVNV